MYCPKGFVLRYTIFFKVHVFKLTAARKKLLQQKFIIVVYKQKILSVISNKTYIIIYAFLSNSSKGK
jgi:hypothetical protein